MPTHNGDPPDIFLLKYAGQRVTLSGSHDSSGQELPARVSALNPANQQLELTLWQPQSRDLGVITMLNFQHELSKSKEKV